MQTAFYQPVHGGAVRELKEFWRGFFAHLGAHFVPHHSNNYHPHIFSNRMTVMLSALLLCAKIFTLAALSLGPAMTAFSSELTPANIIALTNASRQAFGSGLVSENSRLVSLDSTV